MSTLRQLAESLEALEVLLGRLDLEVYPDIAVSVRHLMAEAEKPAKIDVALEAGLEFLDLSAPDSGVADQSGRQASGQRVAIGRLSSPRRYPSGGAAG